MTDACETRGTADRRALEALERLVVLQAAPTLAGVKPANLFSLPYSVGRGEGGGRSALDARGVARAVSQLKRRLAPCGVDVVLLAAREASALILVHRPRELARCLAAWDVRAYLRSLGYRAPSPRACVAELRRRVAAFDAGGGGCGQAAFPHEVGVFLGYPLEDVLGFIEHAGDGCRCSTCWKSYSDEDRARRASQRYRSCTRALAALHAAGEAVESLACRRNVVGPGPLALAG